MKIKSNYFDGLRVGLKLKAQLEPFCDRIEMAGSIRRRCDMVGDIELVAIPRQSSKPGLFGPVLQKKTWLDDHLEKYPKDYRQVRSGERLKELLFEGFSVDLFLTNADRWGVIFTLRTGSAAFSKWLVTSRSQGGARVVDRYVKDGRVWVIGQRAPVITPDEPNVFEALGVPWVPLEKRNQGYWGVDVTSWNPRDSNIFSQYTGEERILFYA